MSTDLFDVALRALAPDEQDAWDAFASEIESADSDLKQVRSRFFVWAGPLAHRIGLDHPGPLWGILVGRHRPRTTHKATRVQPLDALGDSLPYPLGLKLRELSRARRAATEGEPTPQLPFQVCAVMDVLVRLSALIAIRCYVDGGGSDAGLNRLVVDRLRAPTDGGWLEVTQRLCKALDGREPTELARLLSEALASKPTLAPEIADRARDAQGRRVTRTAQSLQALIGYRNALVHGELSGTDPHDRAMVLLELAVRGFAELSRYRLVVRHEGRTWALTGAVPRPTDSEVDLPEGEPMLVHVDGAHLPLSLSPLLRFRPSATDQVDVDTDELFFLNAGSLERLSYIGYRTAGQVDGRALGSYESFKALLSRIPTPLLPEDPRIDFSELAAFHTRLFVGRSDVLEEISHTLAQTDRPHVVISALAGMGKSALMGVLLQAVLRRKIDGLLPSPAEAVLRPQDRWVFHFCMPTDGRNSPTVALRSLIAQICDAFDWPRKPWLSQDLDRLKDELFPGILAQVSDSLKADGRLVVAIDALDEGIGADRESVPSCSPAAAFGGVVFLLSYRVDEQGTNSRVAQQLGHLPAGSIRVIERADPLAGLTRPDVDLFLAKVAEMTGGPAPSGDVHDATWAAASADSASEPPSADPFYLRFLAEGVHKGTVRLDRDETVPESLDDAFEEMWMGLPADRDFLCHRVLTTLAIMREYGHDELFSALFNRDLPDDQRLAPDDVAAVRIKAGKLLVYDGDRYGLFHDRFRRFLVGEQKDPIAEALGTA